MIYLEELDLKAYFETVGIPGDCPDFESWYRLRFQGPDEERDYKATLNLARAYISGYIAGLVHQPGEDHPPAMFQALADHVRENLDYGTPLPGPGNRALVAEAREAPEFPVYYDVQGNEHGEF